MDILGIVSAVFAVAAFGCNVYAIILWRRGGRLQENARTQKAYSAAHRAGILFIYGMIFSTAAWLLP